MSELTELIPGSIVRVNIKGKRVSVDGFAMGGYGLHDDIMIIYEKINIESFPSFRDFYGRSIELKDGCKAMIISKIGRPWKIREGNDIDCYDIYEIMISSSIYQIFKNNLEINTSEDAI